jgi:tetratricopeptide (TPR) repeat protein
VLATLGQQAERRNDPARAAEHYRRAMEADPSNVEAANRLKDIGPPPPVASAEAAPEFQELIIDLEDAGPIHAPQPKVPAIEWEPASGRSEPAPPSGPTAYVAPATSAELLVEGGAVDDQQLETLIVEAEVFAKYGLSDKAIERLFSLLRRRPDLLKARERLVELLAESRNPALQRETEALAAAYREAGHPADASRVLARSGLEAPGAEFPPASELAPPPPAGLDVAFEEFEVSQPAAPPAEMGPAPFDEAGIEFTQPEPGGPPPTIQRLSTPEPVTPADTEFVSYEQLGNLLEDEMQRAGDSGATRTPEVPVVAEENLFADEQKFFNLAEELEKELSEEAVAEESTDASAPQGEVSLEEIFREFKKGVEQQLSAEDYETHYNLGIAYKEMGLVDEAIGEFQLASKDPGRAVECCSMLGHCFLEKGMPQLAIKWFRKGLATPSIKEAETAGMLYDLGQVYQDTGDIDLAYKTFLEVYGLNTNYRDVIRRVRDLEAVRKNS